MASKFYRLVAGESTGPYSAVELANMARAGKLDTSDLVRRDLGHWLPAGEVDGLTFQKRTAAVPADVVDEVAEAPKSLSRFAWPAVALVSLTVAIGAVMAAMDLRERTTPPPPQVIYVASSEPEPAATELPAATTPDARSIEFDGKVWRPDDEDVARQGRNTTESYFVSDEPGVRIVQRIPHDIQTSPLPPSIRRQISVAGRWFDHGREITWGRDGGRSEWTNNLGVQEGVAHSWYPSGKLRSESLVTNKPRHRLIKEWWENGRPRSEASFGEDYRIPAKYWPEDGGPVSDKPYKPLSEEAAAK